MTHHNHGDPKDHHAHEHHHHRHHHHEHHGVSSSDPQSALSEKDKLIKMVEHWIHHSEEHARSYREWAKRANHLGHGQVYSILEEVASATEFQNRNLEKVLLLLREEPSVR